MSADYHPRGGNGGGGRRRRGGRGRGGNDSNRPEVRQDKSSSSSSKPPVASLWSRMFGWMFPVAKKTSSTPQKTTPDSRKDADRPVSNKSVEKESRQREDRPEPAVFDVTSPKLYVGNLSFDAVESDLFDLFSKVGAVKNVEIAKDRYTDRSKGFGFVEMETLETAKAAAQKLDRTEFMARQIRVNGAKADKRVGAASNGAPAEGTTPSNV